MQVIQYGIGKDYLKDWGINEALREIYQNFIDYGTFTQKIISKEGDIVKVIITNDYVPNDLEFLQIGKSIKEGNTEAIGQHGEGLKMAMLIFLRLGYSISIEFKDKFIYPEWRNQKLIGNTLSLLVGNLKEEENRKFTIILTLPKAEFNTFNNNIIKKKDVLFTANYHGDIVNKEKGNLYVGKLFVCKLDNLSKSYNLLPSVLKLDRDRRVPASFETSWHTSKINEAEAKFSFKDQDYDDNKYISSIPSTYYPSIKPKIISNNLEFVVKEGNEEIIIKNDSIKNHLKYQTYFQKAINGIKKFLISKLGVNEMLIEFRNKYCTTNEAREAFDAILERLSVQL